MLCCTVQVSVLSCSVIVDVSCAHFRLVNRAVDNSVGMQALANLDLFLGVRQFAAYDYHVQNLSVTFVHFVEKLSSRLLNQTLLTVPVIKAATGNTGHTRRTLLPDTMEFLSKSVQVFQV
jgi:hypothetical protein